MKRIRESDKRDGWYEFSPADCARFLKKRDHQRPLREWHAKSIASRHAQGRYKMNGEPFIFDCDGLMLNGQHSSRACVIANKPICTYAIWLPNKATSQILDTFDQGRVRTASDRFAMDGIDHSALKSAIVAKVLSFENGYTSGGIIGGGFVKLSSGDFRERYIKNQELFNECSHEVACRAKFFRGWLPTSIVGMVLYYALSENRSLAVKWLDSIATGENLKATDPALLLRNRLTTQALGKSVFKSREVLALTIKSWTLYREGKITKSLKWDSRGAFPTFDKSPITND